jgi:hypothetical protein
MTYLLDSGGFKFRPDSRTLWIGARPYEGLDSFTLDEPPSESLLEVVFTDHWERRTPDLVRDFSTMTPADFLRFLRNRKLEATDKYMISDFPLSDTKREALRAYRQALRDLPSSCVPAFAHGVLVGVVWPEFPL